MRGGRLQGRHKCIHQVKMHSCSHWQVFLHILALQEDATQHIPFLREVGNKIWLLVGIMLVWHGAGIDMKSKIQLLPQSNTTTLLGIKLNSRVLNPNLKGTPMRGSLQPQLEGPH